MRAQIINSFDRPVDVTIILPLRCPGDILRDQRDLLRHPWDPLGTHGILGAQETA